MQEQVDPAWNEPLGLALPPGSQVAGFTLQAQLGKGGAGTLYRACRGDHHVALKVIPKDAWGEREVDALRRVQHSPVVRLLGYGGWPEKRPRYLVLTLELVEGLSLDAWAHQHPPSAHQLVHQVLLPLLSALEQVHAAGVVHRDIKEANVVMRQADGQPVLVDFGCARYEGAPRLTERLPPGTREYRSPEMVRFGRTWDGGHYPSTPADDLWALGVTFYWLLTRQLPFGDRHGPLFERIVGRDPQPARELNPRVPQALGQVCLRMLRKDPLERYPNAQALTLALEEVLAAADDTWEAPLFAPEPKAPDPDAPVLAAPAPRVSAPAVSLPAPRATPRPMRAAPWLVLLIVGLGLLSWRLAGTPTASEASAEAPRTVSPGAAPPRQEGPRQEVALDLPTREVGSSARPPRSPLPAPVAPATHPEAVPMPKRPASRSPLVPTLVATSLCVAPGCVSMPSPMEPPPPPIPCPPGAVQTHKLHKTDRSAVIVFEPAANRAGLVRRKKGESLQVLQVHLSHDWGDFPEDTPLLGHVWFGKDRVYGRLTQVLLPGGGSLPICLDLDFNGPGVPMHADSTPTEVYLSRVADAIRVPYYNPYP